MVIPLELDLSRWFSALRRAMVPILVAMLALSSFWLDLPVSWRWGLPPIVLLVGIEIAALLPAVRTRVAGSEWAVLGFAAIDMVVIAAVLGASGGSANPFTSILFVYVALAAALLSPLRTFLLAALAAVTFGTLFLLPTESCCQVPSATYFSQHLYGMWVAFFVGALVVAFFLGRVRTALLARQREIEKLRKDQADAARFVSLGTLAAGTAHELGTPLSTILVLAEELGRQPAQAEQAAAITAAVERCRDVVNRMRPGARREPSEGGCRLHEAVPRVVDGWLRAHPEARVELEIAAQADVGIAEADVDSSLSVLLDNALAALRDAGAVEAPILVRVSSTPEGPRVSVEDRGVGFRREVASRVGEPFVTTKGPGEGMGLGLFVVRSLFEQAGGKLLVESLEPRGARVSLQFA